ncbi:MAG: hypothetical protein ACRC6S_13515, partial [Shewanella sp.]
MKFLQGFQRVLFLGCAITVLSGCGEKQSTPPVVAEISRPALILTLQPQGVSQTHFSGVVRSAQRAELAFKQSGKLVTMAA